MDIRPNSRVNESDISTADIVVKLKNQNIMQEACVQLRNVFKDVYFGLQDSFCDSTDLKSSWEITSMPGPPLTLLSALFKVPKYTIFQSSVHDIKELLQSLEDEVHEEAEEQLSHGPLPTQMIFHKNKQKPG
ncbi:hypothetical protein DPMN_113649 [Dreissena polymorpha]|uniref:Uncharacterized protein n=1 Tax=Dreissena polymorpha TaxID=45954 RepID=A0A9D4KIM3_DREPO|nr:hypothetical protein DPMN_113649 [Dreissena polymorpha]